MELNNAVVVVTGGTGGLGSDICRAFAREGSRVAVVYLERAALAESIGEEVRELGAAALPVQADVTQAGSIDGLFERIIGEWGRIDVLINNAAFNQYVAFPDLDGLPLELWEKILHSNTTGPFLCSKAVAPIMKRQGQGRIVNIGSIAGMAPTGSSIAYAVSKAALAHLTRCLAVALAPEVIVNAVHPGLMEGTRMTERLHPDQVRRSSEAAILKHVAHKPDVADQVVTFARTDSTTGQNVVIDSGRFFH